jgi:hypothetical protein
MAGIEASLVDAKNSQGKYQDVNGIAKADEAGKSQPLKEGKDRPNRILRYAQV